jgi:hypothetical protein
MEAPLVVVGLAAAVAVIAGFGLASLLAGAWFDLSGVGWLIVAAGFGTFTAFYFWIDTAMVRARVGAPFPERRDAFRTAGGAAAAAVGCTLVFVPTTISVLFGLGVQHMPGAEVVCLLTAALVFAASVAGGIACFRARRRLAAPGRAASDVALSPPAPGWREAAGWFGVLALPGFVAYLFLSRPAGLNALPRASLLSLGLAVCFAVPVRMLRWPAIVADTGFRIWIHVSALRGLSSAATLLGLIFPLLLFAGQPIAFYLLLRDAVPPGSRLAARVILSLAAFTAAVPVAVMCLRYLR